MRRMTKLITAIRTAVVAFPLVRNEVDQVLVFARRGAVTVIVNLATPNTQIKAGQYLNKQIMMGLVA